MTFKDYLTKHKISDAEAAKALQLDRTSVANIKANRRSPSLNVASRIEAWTGGKVKAISFAQQDAA